MDVLSLIGIIMAFVAIIGGNYLEGGHLGALANGPAALIVLGGTVGAAMLQSPVSAFKRAMKDVVWILFPPRIDMAAGIDRVVNWSLTARKEGLLGLESVADAEPDSYSRKGLQLLVDGVEPEAIRSVLEVDYMTRESRDIEAAKVFESMGGYAPTIGIIGAVMGLIHVMGNLADPAQLGSGIAVAFVATIYGVASANLVLANDTVTGLNMVVVPEEARTWQVVLEKIESDLLDGVLAPGDRLPPERELASTLGARAAARADAAALDRALDHEVEHGQHDERQQRRRDEPADDDDRERLGDEPAVPGDAQRHRQKSEDRRERRHEDRAQTTRRAVSSGTRPEPAYSRGNVFSFPGAFSIVSRLYL